LQIDMLAFKSFGHLQPFYPKRRLVLTFVRAGRMRVQEEAVRLAMLEFFIPQYW